MKFFCTCFLFFQYAFAFGQVVITWEDEIFVTQTTAFGNTRPRICITNQDIPLVVFGKATNGLLYAARLNGASFSVPVPLLPPNMSSYLTTWAGPDVASNGDTVVVVFKEQPMDLGKVYSVRSIDGGLTFSDTIRVDNHPLGIAWLPSLDMDENSNPSVVYMAHDANWANPRYNVVHSFDKGLSYQPEMEITLQIPDEACDCCPAEYVISENNHALLFRNNNANVRDIYAVYSDNDGLSYNSFTYVDALNWNINFCPSTGPHGIFNNESLVSVSASQASGKYRVYVSETSFSPTLNLQSQTMMLPPDNLNGAQNYPRITGKNDTIIMVWQESSPSNNDIYAALTLTGSSLELVSSKAVVNDSLQSAQTNPDIVYANGKIHCVFQDAATGRVIYKRGSVQSSGINELNQSIKVFPNPVNSSLIVQSSLAMNKYEIYSINGQLLHSGILNSVNSEIDVSSLVQGSYRLIIGENTEKSFQIIKTDY